MKEFAAKGRRWVRCKIAFMILLIVDKVTLSTNVDPINCSGMLLSLLFYINYYLVETNVVGIVYSGSRRR